MADSEARLPNELIDLALSFLTPVDPVEDRDLRETLKSCCLAGRTLRGLARPLLFKHLLFTDLGVPRPVFRSQSSVSDSDENSSDQSSDQDQAAVENAVDESPAELTLSEVLDHDMLLPVHETIPPSTLSVTNEMEQSLPIPMQEEATLRQEIFTISKFASLLSNTPEIGGFVRKLTIRLHGSFAYTPWIWRAADIVEEIVDSVSQLQSFAFVREDPPKARSANVHWVDLGNGFRSSLARIASIPTLETLDLTYGIMFPDAATFCRVFNASSPKLKTLAFNCLAFSHPNPNPLYPSDQPIPKSRTAISCIELNFLECYIHGPAVVEMLFGDYSPFDITRLEKLKINGVGSDDKWIDMILSGQQDQLSHLKEVFFYEIWNQVVLDIPFRRIAQMQGLFHVKVEPSDEWSNWLKTLPIRRTLLDQREDIDSGWQSVEILHQIFELGGKGDPQVTELKERENGMPGLVGEDGMQERDVDLLD
ncbi:hypothetical protein DL96DRAFT_542671 [Flagelloscypha sp. PMI_526]|nr:hypothetical protein DL96DRAFT_542671 [Flagelloscypha sp. PMI_526]